MSENYPMANIQVDPFYMKALESFKEAVDVKSLKEKEGCKTTMYYFQ